MLIERIEPKWIAAFAATFERCGVQPGDECVVLSESQSRRVNVELSELALARLDARVLMVSNEHPEMLERLVPDPALEAKVKAGTKMLRNASTMRVTSAAGTDLTIDVSNAPAGSSWGYTSRPGTIAHWPGGLCLCFPPVGSANGALVMAPGDVNLTFKRYLESAIHMTIEDDYITDLRGDGMDAQLMQSYMSAWGDREAYAVSHVGWGMNPAARWDSLAMYDKAHLNGTELRAFAGNFLYSTGANEVAGRHTLGHFDLQIKAKLICCAACNEMQMTTHRPEKALGAQEFLVLFGAKNAQIDQICGRVCPVHIFRNPIE